MTTANSHGWTGRNRELRKAVSLLEKACAIPANLRVAVAVYTEDDKEDQF
jgi:hypothetical protein